jgi:hypothetical protein
VGADAVMMTELSRSTVPPGIRPRFVENVR